MLRRLISLIIIIAVLTIALLLWWRKQPAPDNTLQKAAANAEQIERGRYLAKAADCAACHTVSGGARFAGGYPLKTPFGTIYGSNITPSVTHGIGGWTKEQFYTVLTTGVAPGRHYLYPAMPYTSYKGISHTDSAAIYAYLMSLPAIEVPVPENELPFPLNQRVTMIGWNMLFHTSAPMPASSVGNSAEWKRGRYLVDVLGHCGECHTPRGKLGQMNRDKPLQGAVTGRFSAPAITPGALAQWGWKPADLQKFISTGLAPQGSAFSEMHTVIDLSTRHLNADDQKAMVIYLMGDKAPAAVTVKTRKDASYTAGRSTWLNMCAGCHARDGQGKPNVSISIVNTSTLRQPDGRNLVVSILDGLPGQQFPGNKSMQSMPGFAGMLTDEDIAGLVNYLRTTWGGLPGNITPEQIKALRE